MRKAGLKMLLSRLGPKTRPEKGSGNYAHTV